MGHLIWYKLLKRTRKVRCFQVLAIPRANLLMTKAKLQNIIYSRKNYSQAGFSWYEWVFTRTFWIFIKENIPSYSHWYCSFLYQNDTKSSSRNGVPCLLDGHDYIIRESYIKRLWRCPLSQFTARSHNGIESETWMIHSTAGMGKWYLYKMWLNIWFWDGTCLIVRRFSAKSYISWSFWYFYYEYASSIALGNIVKRDDWFVKLLDRLVYNKVLAVCVNELVNMWNCFKIRNSFCRKGSKRLPFSKLLQFNSSV